MYVFPLVTLVSTKKIVQHNVCTFLSVLPVTHISQCANRVVSTPAAKVNFVSGKKNCEKDEKERKEVEMKKG